LAASPVALLDVNVLVALFFPDHVHHDLAHDWFADHRDDGWATCPLTENGFVRVACRQRSADGILRPALVADHLRRFCADERHHGWTDSVSLTDTSIFAAEFLRGHQQITDIYLLGLAEALGGRLATFDRTIPLAAVRGATARSVLMIEP
jgi:hypothetical protein